MTDNEIRSDDQTENHQDDQGSQDDSQPDNTMPEAESVSETAFTPDIDETPPVIEPEAMNETVNAKPENDHAVRNIIIGLIVLIVLLCCCLFFFGAALFASGVLEPLIEELNL